MKVFAIVVFFLLLIRGAFAEEMLDLSPGALAEKIRTELDARGEALTIPDPSNCKLLARAYSCEVRIGDAIRIGILANAVDGHGNQTFISKMPGFDPSNDGRITVVTLRFDRRNADLFKVDAFGFVATAVYSAFTKLGFSKSNEIIRGQMIYSTNRCGTANNEKEGDVGPVYFRHYCYGDSLGYEIGFSPSN